MTLLEGLVVVALTVLVGAIAFPAIGQLNRGLAFETARATLVAELKETRAAAIRTGRGTTLQIEGSGRAYAGVGATVTLGDGIRLGSDRPLAFAGDGSATPATLTLARGAERRVVRLDATGVPK